MYDPGDAGGVDLNFGVNNIADEQEADRLFDFYHNENAAYGIDQDDIAEMQNAGFHTSSYEIERFHRTPAGFERYAQRISKAGAQLDIHESFDDGNVFLAPKSSFTNDGLRIERLRQEEAAYWRQVRNTKYARIAAGAALLFAPVILRTRFNNREGGDYVNYQTARPVEDPFTHTTTPMGETAAPVVTLQSKKADSIQSVIS